MTCTIMPWAHTSTQSSVGWITEKNPDGRLVWDIVLYIHQKIKSSSNIKVCSHCKKAKNQPHQICESTPRAADCAFARIQQIAMPLSTYLSVLPLANHPATRTTSKPKSFLSVPPSLPFIQILHVDGCHWITVSNIDILNGSQRSDSVMICDQTHWILIWLMSTLNQMVGIVVCLQ